MIIPDQRFVMTTGKKEQKWEQMLHDLDLDHVGGVKVPQFSFPRLKGADSVLGVDRAYAVILTLATSQSDIERLHDLLPPDQQVFGEELASLRRVRKAMYDGKPPSNGTRPDDEVCRAMLRMVSPGWRQEEAYYKEKLRLSHRLLPLRSYP